MTEKFEQNLEAQMASLDRDTRIEDQADEIIERVQKEKWENFYNVYEALVRAQSLGHITTEQYALKLNQLEDISLKNNKQSLWENLVPPYDEKDIPFIVEKNKYVRMNLKLPYDNTGLGDEAYIRAYPDLLLTAVKLGNGSLGIFKFDYTGKGPSGYSDASEMGWTSREIVDISRIGEERYLVTSKTEFMEFSRRDNGNWDVKQIAHCRGITPNQLQAEISDVQYLPEDKALLSLVDGNVMLFDLKTLESETLFNASGHLPAFFSHSGGATFMRESDIGKEDVVYFLDENYKPKKVCKSINDGRVQIQALNKNEVMVSQRSGSVDFSFNRYHREGNDWIGVEEYRDDQVHGFQYLPNGQTVSLTQPFGTSKIDLSVSVPRYEYISSLSLYTDHLQMLPDGRILCLENGKIILFDGEVVGND